jgi:hypothetical protein
MIKDTIKELKKIKKEAKQLSKDRKKIIKKFFGNPEIPAEAKKQGLKVLTEAGIEGLKEGLTFIRKCIESLEEDLKQLNPKDTKNAKLIKDKIKELQKLESQFMDQIFKFGG